MDAEKRLRRRSGRLPKMTDRTALWPLRYRRERQFQTREPSPTPEASQLAEASDAAAAAAAAAATAAAATPQGQRERPPLASPHGSLAASIQEHMLRQSPAPSSSSNSNTHLL